MACNLHGEGETCHSFLLVWGSKLSGVLHKKNRNVVKLEKILSWLHGWMSFNMVQHGSTFISMVFHTHTSPPWRWPWMMAIPELVSDTLITQRWYNEGREVFRCFNHIKNPTHRPRLPQGITWNSPVVPSTQIFTSSWSFFHHETDGSEHH
jgi:hypothetical protein